MPLSEHEQRLLEQMERALYAEDPKFASSLRSSTPRPGSRRKAAIGVLAGLVGVGLLLAGAATSIIALGVVGFLVMLGCALAIEHNVRKLGRAGLESLTASMRNGTLKNMLGNAGNRWRERFGRDEPPS